MTQIALTTGADLAGFRQAVRELTAAGFRPEEVSWTSGGVPTFFPDVRCDNAPAISLPRAAHDLIRLVVCHRDPERYALLYALVWRLGTGFSREVARDSLVRTCSRSTATHHRFRRN